MRLLLRQTICLGFVFSAGISHGAPAFELLYPEEVFTELRPLLETALERAPELRSRFLTIEERQGQAMSRAAQSNSSLRAHSRLLGGYENRFNFYDNPRTGNDTESLWTEGRPVATVDASVWWEKPIFAWGNLDRLAEIGQLGVEAAELDYADAVRRHLNEVRATFLRWQMGEQQLRLLVENVALAEKIVDAQRQLFEAGRISEQQLLELEARLLETEERRALHERERQYYHDRLAVLVGDEAQVNAVGVLEIPDFALPESPSQADWMGAAGGSENLDPAIERERRYAQIDATYAESAKYNQRPTLDFVVGLVTNRVDTAEIGNTSMRLIGYAGLQVRWNIFDGGRSRGEQIAALARKRAREARLEAAEARLRDEAAKLAADLRYNRAQADSRARRAELLERRLSLAENPGGDDRVSALDQLDLRLSFLQAEQRTLEAKANYLMTMTQLAALVFEDPIAAL